MLLFFYVYIFFVSLMELLNPFNQTNKWASCCKRNIVKTVFCERFLEKNKKICLRLQVKSTLVSPNIQVDTSSGIFIGIRRIFQWLEVRHVTWHNYLKYSFHWNSGVVIVIVVNDEFFERFLLTFNDLLDFFYCWTIIIMWRL